MNFPAELFCMWQAALPALPRIACSLDYPTRPVRVIVGFPAGSGPDVIARLFGQRMWDKLGQQFIVENRSGAGSSVAAQDVVAAPADGYTLLLAANANNLEKYLLRFMGGLAKVGYNKLKAGHDKLLTRVVFVRPPAPAMIFIWFFGAAGCRFPARPMKHSSAQPLQ